MGNSFRVDKFTAEEWTKYGATFSCNNIYQTWSYGEAHSVGPLYSVSRAILFRGERPEIMAQFRIARIPVIGIGVATAFWGPLWRYDEDPSSAENHLGEFLSEVRKEYGVKRGLQIRFDSRGTFSKDQDACLTQVFETNGFKINSQIRTYRTIVLDLSLDLDVLHANLDSKWRRELGYSEKAGLETEFGTSDELFDRFCKLYDEMWANKTFATGVDIQAIRRTQKIAAADQRCLIWLALHQGEDIGAGVFSVLGNTLIYFLGASSPKARKKTNPGYLLQWLAVRKAKELGLRWYDLGGLTDIPDSGVDKFKTRMNGMYTMFPGRFEAQSSDKRPFFFDVSERYFKQIRRTFRKLR